MARKRTASIDAPSRSLNQRGSAVSSAPPLDSGRSAWQLPDDVVERSLLTGEHADELDVLFGPAGHAELADLARQATTRRRLNAQGTVLILPGIMGSKLGVRKTKLGLRFNDVYWLDPIDFAAGIAGRLELASSGLPGNILPLGVFLFTYLKLKLSLQAAGFDAAFFPYDWRLDLRTLGEILQEHLQSLGSNVSLVAHSMGGLVARAAIQQGAAIERLIMLGTPNYGSYAPIQALRGVYPTVRKLATLDQTRDEQELAEIFASYTGLCQLLPTQGGTTSNYFDPKSWPRTGPRIRPRVLKAAADVQSLLAPPTANFHLILGCNQPTVVDATLQPDGSEFNYVISPDGDGTVPLRLAELPEIDRYYVEEEHGSLPNNRSVLGAVKDLLATGRTAQLPRVRPAARVENTWAVSDSELRLPTFAMPPAAVLPARQQRELLAEFAAPLDSSPPAPEEKIVPEPASPEMLYVEIKVRAARDVELRIQVTAAARGT